MADDCGACISKYILCGFNFIFFLAGSTILSVGLWLSFNKSSIIGLLKVVPQDNLQQFTQPAVIEQVAYILIAVGAFMFIVSFLGYCGALRESQCLLTTYSICLLIILGMGVTATVLAAIYKSEAEQYTKDVLKSVIQKYYGKDDTKDAVTLMIDHTQATLSCCGADNYRDYRENQEWTTKSGKLIPESCCVLDGDPINLVPQAPNCVHSPNDVNSYYRKGCYEAITNLIRSRMDIVIAVACVVGLVKIAGIWMACSLTKAINRRGFLK